MPVPKLPRKYGNRRNTLPANRANRSPLSSRTRGVVAPKPASMRRNTVPLSKPSGITAKAGCTPCQRRAKMRAEAARKAQLAKQAQR